MLTSGMNAPASTAAPPISSTKGFGAPAELGVAMRQKAEADGEPDRQWSSAGKRRRESEFRVERKKVHERNFQAHGGLKSAEGSLR
jgi:hypothetical protein